MEGKKDREVKLLSISIYILDGYRKIGFISRLDTLDLETTLDFNNKMVFSIEEAERVARILNFHGIRHCFIGNLDIRGE